MKKFLVLLFILLLSLSVVACVGKGGASAVKPIQSISSNEQSSSSVSSEQDNFSSSKQSVSESVSSSSSPSEQESVSESINFTSSSSSVSSTPTLSSDTSLNISKVFDKDLNDCSVQLSTQEYDDIVINKNSIVDNTLYTLAEKAKVEAVLN
ncbi:MAG: hypothetical protein J6C97_03730, partial [Clostridia bacterium]|nr:hypothetical protein [Clostridia bacterium]